MNTSSKNKWWIDAALFTAFILAFFLDITGLDLHQWIGAGIGAVVVYHLAAHWKWVQTVTKRFFKCTSEQARQYYILDSFLLLGLAAILITGLVISTWLNLSAIDYAAWRAVHILASAGTLLALVIKLGLHWRWIVLTTRNIFLRKPARALPSTAVPAAARAAGQPNPLSRREFIKVMSVVGVSSVFAVSKSVNGLIGSTDQVATEPAAVQNIVNSQPTAQTVNSQPTTVVKSIPTSVAQPSTSGSTTSGSSSGSVSTKTSCVVRCSRRCSYPGQCRRYIDSNRNSRCDYGECM